MSEKRARLREEVKFVREAAKQKGSLLHELELDDYNLTFLLGKGDNEFNATLVIPESYPRGVYQLIDHHGMNDIGRGKLKFMFDKIILNYVKEFGGEPIPRFPKTDADSDSEAGPAEATRQESAMSQSDEVDPFVPSGLAAGSMVKAQPLIDAVAKLRKQHPHDVGVMIVGGGDHVLRYRIDTSFLDEDTARIWGVHHGVPVIVEFKIIGPYFLESTKRPETDIFQCATDDLNKNLSADKLTFNLSWQLHQRLRETFRWPIQGDVAEAFSSLFSYMGDKLVNATKNCVICDKKLDFVGLKPAVCESALCCYSHMQYGLGEDVASFVHHNPEVTDLLICLTVAAAAGDIKRFCPFPAGVEARVFGEKKGQEVQHSFMSDGGKHGQGSPEPQKVVEVANHLPAIKMLLKYHTTAEMRDYLNTVHPLAFPLLRWIITSNRAHLELVPADLQMPQLGTKFQFVLRSTTPEKEKVFQDIKSKKGAMLAWHGSSFSNWHCILRVGLKNYSGTEYMSCGAAYGNGIYLATNSGTSFGYAGGCSGWCNSEIAPSNATCLALCEIIKAGYKANPYYVIPEENHVSTRFLCVFPGGSGADVVAASLTPPDMSAATAKKGGGRSFFGRKKT